MTARAQAAAVIQVAGLAEVRGALRGVVTEGRRTDRALLASQRDLERGKRDSLGRFVAANRSANDQIIADGQRVSREEQRTLRSRLDAFRRGVRSMRNFMRENGGALASGLMGVGSARMSEFRGALGVGTPTELVPRFIQNQQNLIRLAGNAGADPAALIERVSSVSRSTSTSSSDLIAGLSMAHNRFTDLDFFVENLEDIANAARAAGAPVEDFVGAIGEFRRQMGVSAEDTNELIGAMFSAAQAGSIESGNIASDFSSLIGAFSRARYGREGEGTGGMGGAREALAVFEALGASGERSAPVATLASNLLSSLNNSAVRRRFRSHGVNIADSSGHLNPMADILDAVHSSEYLRNPEHLATIMPDRQARDAMGALLTSYDNTGSNPIRDLMAATDAGAGNLAISNINEALSGSSSGEALALAVNQEAGMLENGDALVQAMTSLVGPMAELSGRFPALTVAVESLASSMGVVASVLGGRAIMTAAMGGGGAAVAGGGAGAVGSAGASGLLGALGGGALGVLMNAIFPDSTGGLDAPENIGATPFETWRSSLSPEAATAFDESLRGTMAGSGEEARGRRLEFMREASARPAVSLTPEAIRALAVEVGRATASALADGAPADGRRPGEPGRGGGR